MMDKYISWTRIFPWQKGPFLMKWTKTCLYSSLKEYVSQVIFTLNPLLLPPARNHNHCKLDKNLQLQKGQFPACILGKP